MRVSAGVIVWEGRVLLCQRAGPHAFAGLWEFPGGGQEPNEDAAQCLMRECVEELGTDILPGRTIAQKDWPGSDGRVRHFTFLLATVVSHMPQCLEHQQIAWATPDSLPTYRLCPVDEAVLPEILAALDEI